MNNKSKAICSIVWTSYYISFEVIMTVTDIVEKEMWIGDKFDKTSAGQTVAWLCWKRN